MKTSKENWMKKITIALFFLMGAFASGTVFAAPDATMITTNPGQNCNNEIRIGWHTPTTITGSGVEYTKKSDTSWTNSKKVTGTYTLCTTWNGVTYVNASNTVVTQTTQVNKYSVVLTDLDPNTEYMYRVGQTEMSDTRYFKTAGASEYNFGWISDAHVYDYLSGRLTAAMNMVSKLTSIASTMGGLNFMFSTGDDTAHGGGYSYWQNLVNHASYKNYMWVSMIGNHDYMDRTSTLNTDGYFRDSHNFPPNGYTGQEGASFWFKYGNALWIILNNEDLNGGAARVTAAQAWVKQVIQNNPSQYYFVAEHYQYFDAINGAANTGFTRWSPIFDECGVDIAFAGNNHIYLRTKSLYGGAVNTDPKKGTVYLQSPSSDNERGQAMNATLTSNADKIVSRWTEGGQTVGGMIMTVTDTKVTVRLYDRNGNKLDDADIPAKRPAPSNLPIVTSVAPTNLNAVSVKNPLELTFNNKMDKTSIESALSFSPAASYTCAWTNNDYTLSIDISQFNTSAAYTLTLNGSIAKDKEGRFLDGAKTDTEKTNYVLNFTTAAPDLNPPKVVSYDPQGIQEEALRPIVRIEFNKPLNASSILSNQITVTNNNTSASVAGTQRYVEVNGRGVLHYFFTSDLTPGTSYKVVLKAGVKDEAGNAMETGLTYNFMPNPRMVNKTQVIDNFPSGLSGVGWWQPSASSSTTGVTADMASSNEIAYSANGTSMRLSYVFTASNGVVRLHRRGDPRFTKYPNTSIQFYLFGDASKSRFRVSVRAGANDGSGTIWSCKPFEIDWAGWRLITWDLYDNSKGEIWLAGDGPIADNTQIDVKDFGLHPANPYSTTTSYLLIDELVAVELGGYYPEVGVEKITAENGIKVASQSGFINISADAVINDVKVFSITGTLIKSIQPQQASYQIPTNDIAQGVYIVKAVTGKQQRNVKVIVR